MYYSQFIQSWKSAIFFNTNSEIKFFAGGINDANVAVKIKANELK
jgi:hypothetical protein